MTKPNRLTAGQWRAIWEAFQKWFDRKPFYSWETQERKIQSLVNRELDGVARPKKPGAPRRA